MSENFKKEVTPYEQAEPQPESVHCQPAAERRAEQEPAEHPEQKEQRAPVLTAACTDAQETGGSEMLSGPPAFCTKTALLFRQIYG